MEIDKQEVEEIGGDKTLEEQPLEQFDCPVSRPESDPVEMDEKVELNIAQRMAECDSVQENELEEVKFEDSSGDLGNPIEGQFEYQGLTYDNRLEEETNSQAPEIKANWEYRPKPESEHLVPVSDDVKITSNTKS